MACRCPASSAFSAGSVIEAWSGGVKLAASLSANHTERTQVDLFELKVPLSPSQEQKIALYLIHNIGKGYSYAGVAQFVPIVRLLFPRPPMPYFRKRVFCSQLVMVAFAVGGVHLLERCDFWQVPPRDIPRSPLLFKRSSVWTGLKPK